MKVLWFTYRKWSFKLLERLSDILDDPTVITTKHCKYDLGRFRRVIEVTNPKDISDLGARGELNFYNGWSWKVPTNLLKYGIHTTLHPAKLPKYRGGSPLQNQIINGETETEVNILELREEMDSGRVFMKEKMSLEGDIEEIWERMIGVGDRLTRRFIKDYIDGKLHPKEQIGTPTIYRRIKPKDSEIKPYQHTALQMFNMIRSLNEKDPNSYIVPAYIISKDGKRVYIHQATKE